MLGHKTSLSKLKKITENDSTYKWYHIVFAFLCLTYFSSVQSLSLVQLIVTPWTAARQASQSITNSQSLLKFMSTALVMPSNHLILCPPLLLVVLTSGPNILWNIQVVSVWSVQKTISHQQIFGWFWSFGVYKMMFF